MRGFSIPDRNKVKEESKSRDSQTALETSIIASSVSFAHNQNNASPDVGQYRHSVMTSKGNWLEK